MQRKAESTFFRSSTYSLILYKPYHHYANKGGKREPKRDRRRTILTLLMQRKAGSTFLRLSIGSPMPMNTMLLTRSPKHCSTASTWSTISCAARWREKPPLPVAQNAHFSAQPTWHRDYLRLSKPEISGCFDHHGGKLTRQKGVQPRLKTGFAGCDLSCMSLTVGLGNVNHNFIEGACLAQETVSWTTIPDSRVVK